MTRLACEARAGCDPYENHAWHARRGDPSFRPLARIWSLGCPGVEVRREMVKFMPEGDQGMLRLLPHRCRGPWEGRIGEGTQRNTNSVRSSVGAPIHRRAATRAKIKPKPAPFLAVAHVLGAHTFDPDLFPREKHADAKRRAGPALTFPTVAGDDKRRLAGGIGSERPAAAMGSSHVAPLLIDRSSRFRSSTSLRSDL